MRIAQVLAGISLAEADVLRKAVGKKDAELIQKELGKFVEKSVARGYDRKIIEELAGQIETFGRYGFNKSHSVAYSVVSYHTAWLKAHYPAEFMAALLSSSHRRHRQGGEVHQRGARDGHRGAAARRERVGLQVHRARREADPLRPRRDPQRRSRRDRLDPRRAAREAVHELLRLHGAGRPARLQQARVRGAHRGGRAATGWAATARSTGRRSTRRCRRPRSSSRRRRWARSRCSATGGRSAAATAHAPRVLPNVAPMAEAERLSREKEILGFYISGHPLEPFRVECELFATHTVSQLGKWTPEPMTLGVVDHRDQAADQQAVGRGVRAVDSGGFFGIFRGPGLSGELGAAGRPDSRRRPRADEGRLLEAGPGRGQPDVHRGIGDPVRRAPAERSGRPSRSSWRWASRSPRRRCGTCAP